MVKIHQIAKNTAECIRDLISSHRVFQISANFFLALYEVKSTAIDQVLEPLNTQKKVLIVEEARRDGRYYFGRDT